MLDCTTCKQTRSVYERELRRCGYLDLPPLPDDEDDRIAVTRGIPLSDHVDGLEVCPGFTLTIPDVADVAGAARHWSVSALPLHLAGQDPTETLMLGLQVLQSAREELDAQLTSEEFEKNRRPQPWA